MVNGVIVTGATSGIGEATAKLFAEKGYPLFLTYHTDKSKAEDLQRECFKIGAPLVELCHLDLRNNDSILACNSAMRIAGPDFVALINNAGIIDWTPFEQMVPEQIDDLITVNLSGLIKLTRLCLPRISKTIINVASDVGTHAHPHLIVYSASKAGVLGFTRALALQYPRLRIFSVSPDKTATQMNKGEGRSPAVPAGVIWAAVEDRHRFKSGTDIDVKDLVESSKWREMI